MIIVTGAAGFIGSCLVQYLNEQGSANLILVDDFSPKQKRKNWVYKKYLQTIERDVFPTWFEAHARQVEMVFHLGARTDTTEFDESIFQALNIDYSKQIWNICTFYKIPLIYASSAATYGNGELGYDDNHEIVKSLQPLNPYGKSKNDFDLWALSQKKSPPYWAGLKFFNVYGPNEYHKGRMASVIFHAFHKIKHTGEMKLFRSHKEGIADGQQKRDFVYVKDVVRVCHFLSQAQPEIGLFNIGTGKARTFLDLTRQTFSAMNLIPNIEFIDTPLDIRDKYQYFTQANMKKLLHAGYKMPFHSLEAGVQEYVGQYLLKDAHF